MKTGEYIDLYGEAEFSGKALEDLQATLTEAKRLVNAQPAIWDVHVGTETAPINRVIFRTIHRDEFQTLLEKLTQIVALAKQWNGRVVFFGD